MDSLESLFQEAKKDLIAKRQAAEAKAKLPRRVGEAAAPEQSTLFTAPENWKRVGGVALVHKDTDTLMGNFSEYLHASVPGCRRLLREQAPITVLRTEYVEGSWYLEAPAAMEPRQAWHEKRSCFLHLLLPELGVHAPLCELEVFISYGAIARVELAVATVLAQTEGQQEQLLTLPAGTNVLPVMAADCKMALRKELAL